MNELAPIIPRGRPTACVAMRNFRLDDFLAVTRRLAELREFMSGKSDLTVADLGGTEISQPLTYIKLQLIHLNLDARYFISKAQELVTHPKTHCSLIAHYLEEAQRSIDYQIKTDWVYFYGGQTPNISDADERWSAVLKSFPSTRFEVQSALDCFALGHFTASVFHFMRLAEHGLRALAKELEVTLSKDRPLSHANWNDIIGHCDKRVKEIGHSAPPGDAKDAALSFYATALAHIHALKNKYRNSVMHSMREFDIDDAVDASRVTKALMDVLASKLSEKKKKKGIPQKIDWGFQPKS